MKETDDCVRETNANDVICGFTFDFVWSWNCRVQDAKDLKLLISNIQRFKDAEIDCQL